VAAGGLIAYGASRPELFRRGDIRKANPDRSFPVSFCGPARRIV